MDNKIEIGNYYYDPVDMIGMHDESIDYLGYEKSNPATPVVIKVIMKIMADEKIFQNALTQLQCFSKVKSDNVAKVKNLIKQGGKIYIINEYCEGGDLKKHIKSKGTLSESEAINILKQIVSAFLELDELKISECGNKITLMHRAVEPRNILFQEGNVKLSDFGLAKFINSVAKDEPLWHSLVGTPLYRSPQILLGENYSCKCDVWSMGCVLYECLFGSPPYTGIGETQLIKNIRSKKLEFPKKISEEVEDLIKKMLAIREQERLDWKGLSQHPALRMA